MKRGTHKNKKNGTRVTLKGMFLRWPHFHYSTACLCAILKSI